MERVEAATPSAWLLLGVAIALRFSEGFTLVLPTVTAIAAFALALYLVSRVMKRLPVSVAYPVWAEGGTAGVALVGVLMLKERAGALKGLGIALVVVGIVALDISS